MSSKTIFPDHWHGKDAESEGTGIPPGFRRSKPVGASALDARLSSCCAWGSLGWLIEHSSCWRGDAATGMFYPSTRLTKFPPGERFHDTCPHPDGQLGRFTGLARTPMQKGYPFWPSRRPFCIADSPQRWNPALASWHKSRKCQKCDTRPLPVPLQFWPIRTTLRAVDSVHPFAPISCARTCNTGRSQIGAPCRSLLIHNDYCSRMPITTRRICFNVKVICYRSSRPQ